LFDCRWLDGIVRFQFLPLQFELRFELGSVIRSAFDLDLDQFPVEPGNFLALRVPLLRQFFGLILDQFVERFLPETVCIADVGENRLVPC
jgi:hypothetical protein